MQSAGQKLFRCVALAVLALVATPDDARAQSVQRIAAIVNDELITAYDLETRMKLVILSTRLPNTRGSQAADRRSDTPYADR